MSRFETVASGGIVTMYDAAAYPDFDAACFDTGDWRADETLAHTQTGRGGVRMLARANETWVRRHYHRGGIVSRIVYDHYLWTGLDRSRPVRELKLLAHMRDLGLPVPAPVAGRVVVTAPVYRADLITVLLPDTQPLSRVIAAGRVVPEIWPRIGAMLAAFHHAGIDHPDLTAHNILVDGEGRTWLLDFDNAALRQGERWQPARIARLRRSLNKVALETGTTFDHQGWSALFDAYRSA